MKVLLVGNGGREHALAWRIQLSPLVDGLVVTQLNPGFPADAVVVSGDIVAAALAHEVGLVVVGPEAPLAAGLSDDLRAAGLKVFAPSKAAAQLESSKAFAKAFMDRHGIPTAEWSTHDNPESAHKAIVGACVVKADGLAAGKGVIIADDAAEAHVAVDRMFDGAFGEAGHRVLIEQRLEGPELSVLAFCDGKLAVPLLPCRDHKRRFDGDKGPNTGGMGAICPPADATDALVQSVLETVLQPTVDGMAAEGMPFRGVLYAGVMLTESGPKVLEFNVRFGDPECQPLMLMLDEDIVPLMLSAAAGELESRPFKWRPGAACCVVMASGGYPGPIEKGHIITGVAAPQADAVTFFAGAQSRDGILSTAGGRVLGVTTFGSDLKSAATRAYEQVSKINFEAAVWRSDIGGTR